ncbi:hypothetical protein D3C79_977610 [compost metagenome]
MFHARFYTDGVAGNDPLCFQRLNSFLYRCARDSHLAGDLGDGGTRVFAQQREDLAIGIIHDVKVSLLSIDL